jgi:cytochrome c
MSGLELNKIAGAVLTAALFFMVIGFIGDALVQPKKHSAASVTVTASKAPAAPVKAEPLPPIAPLLASADVAAGKKGANKCKACHDLTSAKANKIGPPLWDIVSADKHAIGGYSYSKAMMGMGGKWTYEDLNKFLANPKGFIKGTKMVFAGVKKAKDRANLIAFLRSLSDSPKPMP